MVSKFLCEYYGLGLFDKQRHSLPEMQIVRWGREGEGYWTNEDLLKQTKKAIMIFKIIHANCDTLFNLARSANHNAFDPDVIRQGWIWPTAGITSSQ